MAPYSYNKLNPERREIRLCALHRGSLDDPLICTLKTVSLDDNPEYESLSYVWGEPIFNKEIEVNKDTTMLTTSLHTALRYLRKPHESRMMWADGICINQNDVNERSSQVGMMCEIYGDAKHLQIWLGEVSEMARIAGHGDEDSNVSFDDVDRATLTTFHDSGGPLTSPPPLAAAASASEDIDVDVLGAFDILGLFADNRHFHEMPFFTFT